MKQKELHTYGIMMELPPRTPCVGLETQTSADHGPSTSIPRGIGIKPPTISTIDTLKFSDP